MFKDLEWKSAFKRAAILVAIWLVSIYVLSVAFPGSFSLGTGKNAEILTMLFYGIFFFCFFVVFTAFAERRKKRRLTELNAQRKGKPGATRAKAGAEDGEEAPTGLKGRHNPNTSRKKASRRRRR